MGRIAELVAVIEGMNGQYHAILSQDGPDPDVLGSGEALRMLLLSNGIKCDFLYSGRVTHPQNRAMVKLLDIKTINYGDSNVDFGRYDGFWFVDTQGDTVEAYRDERIASGKVLGVIDHHKPSQKESSHFQDIRTDYGSTSTILAEYFQELGVLKDDDPESTRVATALVLGILTDTKSFRNASRADYKAHEFLLPYADKELIERIENQPISREALRVLGRAIQSMQSDGTVALSGVGYVSEDERDAIPVAADVLMRTEGVQTVLVYGIVGNYVDLSMRTESDKVDPQEFMGKLGRDERGRPRGGGKKNEGGGKIPLGFFSIGAEGDHADEDSRADVWKMVDRNMKRLYQSGTEDPQPEELSS